MRSIVFVSVLALSACSSPSEQTPTSEAGVDTGVPAALDAAQTVDAAAPEAEVADASEESADAAPDVADAPAEVEPWQCTKLAKAPPCPAQAPKYADVTPFFVKYCVSCHTATGLENMTTYDGIVYQQTNVISQLEGCLMPNTPPWPTMDERQKVLEWLACGAQQ
jgi:hypothetical protein